jgi:hypothetical protein
MGTMGLHGLYRHKQAKALGSEKGRSLAVEGHRPTLGQ